MLEKNEIIQSVLRNLRIEELNPMQEASLEQATGKKDVILLSPTGSGKTLAYLLPLLLTLKTDDGSVQVLILVPSRELALQIDSVFKAMGTSWKTCCCYGGHPIAEEKKSILGNHPAIIIGNKFIPLQYSFGENNLSISGEPKINIIVNAVNTAI